MSAEIYISLGLGLFLILHIFTGIHEWRQAVLSKIGIIAYRVLFSIATLFAYWCIIQGFNMRPFDVWWQVPQWAYSVPKIFMPFIAGTKSSG